MTIKSYRYLGLFGAGFLVTFAAYIWFSHSPYSEAFFDWARHNILLLYGLLFAIKVTGIIWPPLPGGFFVLGSIPVLGWWQAYLIDFAGTMAASSLAYVLGKKYGLVLLQKMFDEATIAKIRRLKIKEKREIESVFLLRVMGGGVLVEVVCYAGGFLGIKYHNFLVGSILSHIVFAIPVYYFFGTLFSGTNLIFGVASAVILVLLFVVLRGRYFE